MTLDCLTNLIGIDGTCSDTTPTSGLFITELTGISLKSADAAIDNSFLSGKELIEKKIQFAKDAVLARLRAHIAQNVKINSNLENDTIGFFKDNLVELASVANQFRGILVRMDREPNLEFYVNTISLQWADAVTTNIQVYDLLTGLQVGTDIPITTVTNDIVTVQVNRSYISDRQRLHLIFVVDSGLSDSMDTSIHKTYQRNCPTCYECWDSRWLHFQGIRIAQGAEIIENNVSSINGTNGMSLNYSLNCSLEAFVCGMGSQLAWSILHKAGAEIMKEMVYSTRLNSIVTVHSRDKEKLRDEFETEYETSIKEVMENIVVPNDICFSCNPRTKWQTRIP